MSRHSLPQALRSRWANLAHLCAACAALCYLISTSAATAQFGDVWRASQWQLWRIEVDGSGLEPLDQTSGSRCGSPVWSPTGDAIVYDVSYGNDLSCETVVIRHDGTDRRVVCQGHIPCWSPNGELILSHTPEGPQVMNADGTGRESLFPAGSTLRWSPRGDRIASRSMRGMRLFDLRTGTSTEILTGNISFFHGYGISPDGLRFCIGSAAMGPRDSGQGSVGLATLDEDTMQASVRWLVDSGIAYHTTWSPDGRHVAFAWHPTTQDLIQIYTMDVDKKEEPKLLPGLDTTRHNVNPTWSPDGKTIVFSSSAPL